MKTVIKVALLTTLTTVLLTTGCKKAAPAAKGNGDKESKLTMFWSLPPWKRIP